MALEHRRNAQHTLHFEVTMRYRQRRFPLAQVRDLSPEGVYVLTTNLTLPIGTLIEVELDRWGRQWLIPAIVVDADTCGVVLMFRTPQPELFAQATSESTAPRPTAAGAEAAASPA